MPTATTCPHGLDAGTCLICATLGAKPARTAIPAGKAEVLSPGAAPHRRHRVGLTGGLLLFVIALVVLWFVIGLLWAFVRSAELVLVGGFGAYVGYRVGVLVGRHRR